MAEENGAQKPAEMPTMPKLQILGQFIRDMSFENLAVQKAVTASGQPDVQVKVSLDARKRQQADGQGDLYEVIIKLVIDSKTKEENPAPIFLLELDYGGLFKIDNVPDEQMHPFLMIECPRMLFPFARRVVSDITRDGGFMPLNLENIDFVALYRNELARRAAQQKTADA